MIEGLTRQQARGLRGLLNLVLFLLLAAGTTAAVLEGLKYEFALVVLVLAFAFGYFARVVDEKADGKPRVIDLRRDRDFSEIKNHVRRHLK